MDVGRLDELLQDNRRMYDLLKEQGYPVTYREFSSGHNYTAWRDDLWRGLEAMFPPSR
jgi:enterochelin esterase family protein